MTDFEYAFAQTLQHEGGYVDHEADPGGATNYGVSLRYLRNRGDLDGDGLPDGDLDGDGDVDVDDIRRLTINDAKRLYHSGFWMPNRLNEVQSRRVAAKVFDMAVNMGSRQAWRIVQRACNEFGLELFGDDLVVDGIVGRKTLAAVNYCIGLSTGRLMTWIQEEQRKFYRELVAKRPELGVFLDGWTRRAMA